MIIFQHFLVTKRLIWHKEVVGRLLCTSTDCVRTRKCHSYDHRWENNHYHSYEQLSNTKNMRYNYGVKNIFLMMYIMFLWQHLFVAKSQLWNYLRNHWLFVITQVIVISAEETQNRSDNNHHNSYEQHSNTKIQYIMVVSSVYFLWNTYHVYFQHLFVTKKQLWTFSSQALILHYHAHNSEVCTQKKYNCYVITMQVNTYKYIIYIYSKQIYTN
jgi:hypothetical protein